VEHSSTVPTGPGLVQCAKCIEPSPTQQNKKKYFLIVFYSLGDVVFAEFDRNSNFVPDYILQVMLLHV
jgi:hypothetical protein